MSLVERLTKSIRIGGRRHGTEMNHLTLLALLCLKLLREFGHAALHFLLERLKFLLLSAKLLKITIQTRAIFIQ
jgi:hypothetical protein